MTRRLDIQGLRALAVLLVVAYHAGLPLPGGFTGVDVFFVISGFVITGTLAGELSASGRVSLRRFYVRRIKRLLPALALMLTFVAAAGTLVAPLGGLRMGAMTGIFASFFSANLYLEHLTTGYFDVSTTLNPLLHTWTLAVEEQFYIVFPTLLAAGWWLGRSGSRMAGARARSREIAGAVIAIACLFSFLSSYALSSGSVSANRASDARFAFYSSPTRAWEFGLGALAVLAAPLLGRMPGWAAKTLGAAGALAIVITAFTVHEAGFRETSAILPVAGACFLLAAGVRTNSGVSRALSVRPAVWIGDLSYSLYLWHWPLIVFAKALWPGHGWVPVAAAAASLVPSWLSYRFVENPIRYHSRLGSRSSVAGRTALALAALCIALPVVASIGLFEARSALGSTASVKAWTLGQRLHVDVGRGCDNSKLLATRQKRSACTWTVAKARGEIVLYGDSNAGQFSEPVIRAGNRAGYDVTVTTHSSCPYLGVRLARCPRLGYQTLLQLIQRKPSLVILATFGGAALAARPEGGAAASEQSRNSGRGRSSRSCDSFRAKPLRRFESAGRRLLGHHLARPRRARAGARAAG